ncbi:single-stranded-DNA-specific exonuclease RecJ [Streptococcus sp. zg-JUN1979]|uniref:single-stranded-DNA-specific exonuclease RecJ n=1 Tax=Streptococcus sp. zg-JUN1979 TaxID=3391450 RepID=UPI0039A728C0
MISAQYQWQLQEKEPDEAFYQLSKTYDLDGLSARILYARGIDDKAKLERFFGMDVANLYDPYLLFDMEKAVGRIREAIEKAERILIYGDYDADGMTSASIVKETLEMMGAEVEVYLPNRFTDGYGPNQSVYKYFIEEQGISLIITVDNGVAGHEAIRYAQKSKGVDVIVTDHHSLPEHLPEAYAIIHPEHPEGDYPFKSLAGCGVAFKLACALLEAVPHEMLDLVAIGTIADMVSLTDENRLLVSMGLQVLKTTERIGLQELLAISHIEPYELTEESIGFQIAPQLNALGRLDDPNPAIELLTGFDDQEASLIAKMIATKNEERKAIVEAIVEEAKEMIDDSKSVQILAKEGWHPGVLGIVAGRLLEQLSKPVILLSIDGDLAKGSARSVEALDIFEALNCHRELFVAFGGHSGAAGMTIEVAKLEDLSQALEAFVKDNHIDLSQKKTLYLDASLSFDQLTLDMVTKLNKLAPFGMDHKKPIFWLKEVKVTQARTMGQDNSHLKLKLEQGETSYDLVAFNQGDKLQDFQQAQHLELAVSLSINKWNGKTSLQLMLEDARVTGLQLIDCRAKTSQVPAGVPDIFKDPDSPVVAIYQVPKESSSLAQLLTQGHYEAIYFQNEISKPYYLTGYGSREQFAKLYKTIYQYPEFDVRYKLSDLSAYLKIDKLLVIKMIQIFEELGFVTITDGVMTLNKSATKKTIDESHIYQQLKKEVLFQELMALSSPQDIYDYLTKSDEKV